MAKKSIKVLKTSVKKLKINNKKKLSKIIGNKPKFIITEIDNDNNKTVKNDKINNNSDVSIKNKPKFNNPNNPKMKNNNNLNPNRFRKQCFEERMNKGLVLLSSKIENKIY